MKRIFVLIGIAALLFLFAACDGNDNDSGGSSGGGNQTAQESRPAENQPSQDEPAGGASGVLGRWEYVSGTYIYFFEEGGDIEFFSDSRVREFSFGEPGSYSINGNRMTVTGDIEEIPYNFTFEISGNTLTITDHDGDSGTWRRVSQPERDGSALVGRWVYDSGTIIYFFEAGEDIEFFADGRVTEYGFNEPGTFTVHDNGVLRVIGEWFNGMIYYFTYEVSGDTLTITDEDGDRGVWRRR